MDQDLSCSCALVFWCRKNSVNKVSVSCPVLDHTYELNCDYSWGSLSVFISDIAEDDRNLCYSSLFSCCLGNHIRRVRICMHICKSTSKTSLLGRQEVLLFITIPWHFDRTAREHLRFPFPPSVRRIYSAYNSSNTFLSCCLIGLKPVRLPVWLLITKFVGRFCKMYFAIINVQGVSWEMHTEIPLSLEVYSCA